MGKEAGSFVRTSALKTHRVINIRLPNHDWFYVAVRVKCGTSGCLWRGPQHFMLTRTEYSVGDCQ